MSSSRSRRTRMTGSLTPSNSFSKLSVTDIRTASSARNSYASVPVACDSFWRSLRSRSYMKTDCDFESVVPYASKTSTRLCLSNTLKLSKLIRIALGRTRICGSKLESILRKSRGKRPYLAISSLFLNSPLTSVTFPCSSSSVHRILSSFVGRIIRPRLLPKPAAPGESSWGADGAWSWASLRRRADLKTSQTFCGWLVENVRRFSEPSRELVVHGNCEERLKPEYGAACCCSASLPLSDEAFGHVLFIRSPFGFDSSPDLEENVHCCLFCPAQQTAGDSKAFFTWARRKVKTDGDGA